MLSQGESGEDRVAVHQSLPRMPRIPFRTRQESQSSMSEIRSVSQSGPQSQEQQRGNGNDTLRVAYAFGPKKLSTMGGVMEEASKSLSPRSIGSRNAQGTHGTSMTPVSFVPLDLETPLEEQYGGQVDCILHKMTEDILAMARLLHTCPKLAQLGDWESFNDVQDYLCGKSMEEIKAVHRVYRLVRFCHRVVDDPMKVVVVMSRATMSERLQHCLQDVQTTHGIPTLTPMFTVVYSLDEATVLGAMTKAGLSFPVVIKPLDAAGTKSSHDMAVVFDFASLVKIGRPP